MNKEYEKLAGVGAMKVEIPKVKQGRKDGEMEVVSDWNSCSGKLESNPGKTESK